MSGHMQNDAASIGTIGIIMLLWHSSQENAMMAPDFIHSHADDVWCDHDGGDGNDDDDGPLERTT